jgi:predicted DNA-binding transcriptional regulator AlpA
LKIHRKESGRIPEMGGSCLLSLQNKSTSIYLYRHTTDFQLKQFLISSALPQALDFFVGTNAQDIMTIQQFITLTQLMFIANISESTARRRHAETLAGIGNFPRSVNAPGKKLLFRPEDVEAWASAGRPTPAAIETTSQRSKRHSVAMNRLAAKGVRVPNSKPLGNKET